MPFKRWNPGCPCCESLGPCVIRQRDFNFDGPWEDVVFTNIYAVGVGQVVQAKVTTDDSFRIAVAWEDEDNYLFGLFTPGSGDECGTFSVWQRAAGVETQLSDTQLSRILRASEQAFVRVCYSGNPDDQDPVPYPDGWINEDLGLLQAAVLVEDEQGNIFNHRTIEAPEGIAAEGRSVGLGVTGPATVVDYVARPYPVKSPLATSCPACDTCHIFQDNFHRPNNATDVGCEWEMDTDITVDEDEHYIQGPAEGIVKVVHPASPNHITFRVQAAFNLDIGAGLGELEIRVAYVDADNYLYAKYEASDNLDVEPWATFPIRGEFSIGRVESGTPTVLQTVPVYDHPTEIELTVCLADGQLRANATTSPILGGTRYALQAEATGGTTVGFSVNDYVAMEWFLWDRHPNEAPRFDVALTPCRECDFCDSCADNEYPEFLAVAIDGLPSVDVAFRYDNAYDTYYQIELDDPLIDNACFFATIKTSDINGIYTLPFIGAYYNPMIGIVCRWGIVTDDYYVFVDSYNNSGQWTIVARIGCRVAPDWSTMTTQDNPGPCSGYYGCDEESPCQQHLQGGFDPSTFTSYITGDPGVVSGFMVGIGGQEEYDEAPDCLTLDIAPTATATRTAGGSPIEMPSPTMNIYVP